MANLALPSPAAPSVVSRFAVRPPPLRQENASKTRLAAPSFVASAARFPLSATRTKPDALKKPVDILPALLPFRADSMKLVWGDINGHGLQQAPTMIRAAWTRRSSGQPPTRKNKKSWGQRVDKYMKPFILDINISRRYISAKVMHRVTSKVVSVVSTNSRDLRDSLPSLIDANACKAVGRLLAERTKEADVFAITYEPRKHEKLEGRLALVLDTILANDIVLV